MKFLIENFFSKCEQTSNILRIWSHLLKKTLMENFISCAVNLFWLKIEKCLPQQTQIQKVSHKK